MRRFDLALSAAALMVLSGASLARGDSPAPPEAQVDAIMKSHGVGAMTGPGCAISITRAGAVLMAKGYGAADIEHGVPFGLDTVSETGSVAKQVTAAAILMLAEQGRLSLDDDVHKYLPELPDYGAKVRLYNLLHHTSGIREWATIAALRGYPRFNRKAYSMADFFKLVSAQRTLNFAPGERYQYSNSNYGLLSIIVGRVSGMSAAQFGASRLFGPLGMSATQWRDDMRRVVPRRATAYRSAGQGFEQAMPFEDVYGHGGLLTTVGDLQLWNKALLGGGLSPYVAQHMLERGKLSDGETRDYAGGIFVTTYRGHRVYRHGGNTAGYAAQLWSFPDDRISIALLCNARVGEADIAVQAADVALGLAPAPRAAKAAAGAPPPDKGAVSYFKSAHGELVAIKAQGGARSINLFTGGGFKPVRDGAEPGEATVADDFGVGELRFDGSDRIKAWVDTHDATLFVRMPAAKPSRGDLAGRYWSADLGTAYAIHRKAGGYRMELADAGADIPLAFDLQWLNGDTYLAHVDDKTGNFRNDLIATFTPGRRRLFLSSVLDLQGVDDLAFTRQGPAR